MKKNRVVSNEEWIAARRELLAREKEHTRQRDALTRERLALPWTAVEKHYAFEGPEGEVSLGDLFGEQSQLLVYHFMFDPEWDEGCKSCSLIADHFDPLLVHLRARDVALVTVSRAPLAKLLTFRERMGWSFPWVSSHGSEFNYDFDVTFEPEALESGDVVYNFERGVKFPVTEAPGMSSFAKDGDKIYRTYSVYARGLEDLMGIYAYLDRAPKGRDETDLSYGMEWVRHRDRYDDETFVDPYEDL